MSNAKISSTERAVRYLEALLSNPRFMDNFIASKNCTYASPGNIANYIQELECFIEHKICTNDEFFNPTDPE